MCVLGFSSFAVGGRGSSSNVKFVDIIGLGVAKKALHEIVVLPALRPEVGF
jgi:SpoVK/Ycf46/Vps4 family AAA+-type ATPase